MSTHKIWLLKLVPPIRFGRVLTGVLLLALLLPLFYAGTDEAVEHNPPALFFSLIIAYIIPVFSLITAKSQEALQELRPLLDIDDATFEWAESRLDSASPWLILCFLVGGALAGFTHLTFIQGSIGVTTSDMFATIPAMLTFTGTLMVWVVMTTAVSMLLQQALLFRRLGGRDTRVSLLNAHQLIPFGRVSITSSLALIGALALFPLIGLESGQNLMETLPGAISILGPLVVMFIIPVWPIHRRLVAMKEAELQAVNARIDACLDASGRVNHSSEGLPQVLPLVQYRRELVQISTWPLNLGNVTVLAFYLVIPPLTWVGAALIENLVDALL